MGQLVPLDLRELATADVPLKRRHGRWIPVDHLVILFFARDLEVITQSDIQGQLGRDLPVILPVEGNVLAGVTYFGSLVMSPLEGKPSNIEATE